MATLTTKDLAGKGEQGTKSPEGITLDEILETKTGRAMMEEIKQREAAEAVVDDTERLERVAADQAELTEVADGYAALRLRCQDAVATLATDTEELGKQKEQMRRLVARLAKNKGDCSGATLPLASQPKRVFMNQLNLIRTRLPGRV